MTGYLTPVFGEDLAPIANLVVGFLIIVLAVFVCLWLWRKLSGGSFSVGARARRARLGVLESAQVDSRRRLLLVRRDNVGHLVMTGGPSDVVVENNIDLSTPQDELSVQPAAVAVEPVKTKTAVNTSRIDEQAPKPAEPAPKPAEPAPKAIAPAPRPVEPSQQPNVPAEAVAPTPKPQPKELVPTELTSPPVVAAASAAAVSQIDKTVRAEAPVATEAPALAAEIETVPPVEQADPPMETTDTAANAVAPAVDTVSVDDNAAHELDPELLQELQATLNKKTDTAGAETSTDVSLEREMSKLLNNLSTERSG